MSECVVRMEMPESCKKCKNPICLWLNDDGDFIVDHTIAAVQDFRKKNDDGFPYFCPILCQLPEGHGRLIDAYAFEKDVSNALVYGLKEIPSEEGKQIFHVLMQEVLDNVKKRKTIVPAEAERSE